jgi:LSD1 subclass zinc finger protein
MRGSVVVFSLIAALMLAACGASAGGAAGDPARGKQLFLTGGASNVPCATCHAFNGETLVGPSLQGISTRAASRVAGLSAQDYIRQSIQSPSAYVVPNFDDKMFKKYSDTLSKQDIDDLVAFLMTQ